MGIVCAGVIAAEPVAYWRFEQGPAGAVVSKPFGVQDVSGNGNHLDPWTAGGANGFVYRVDRPYAQMPGTGADNLFSVKNSGGSPGMGTRSTSRTYGTGSNPTGIDIEAITPTQFTIEAFFKPETGGYRTIVGRDASGVATHDSALAALYFQIRPDQSVAIAFADVSGYWHVAASSANLIQGFNFGTDPDGTTGKWYYMAAISDGSKLSLYLADIAEETEPRLVALIDMMLSGSPNRALAKGSQNGTNWHAGGWSVGRGLWNGGHTDRAFGYIDEVRIWNTALSPAQLMVPKVSPDRNPVIDAAADPDILLVGDTVWLYPTSGQATRFYAFSSKNMVHWQAHGTILNFNNIAWIPSGKNAWAPGVIEKNGMYYFYYSVGPKPSHIGVAYSSSPAGPFIDSGGPLLSDNNDPTFEAIDAMAFTDPKTGISYLYAGGSAGSRLRVFELNPNMISFAREITVQNPANFTEGAFMHYRNGVYYLSYSHGSWNRDSYSVHYCTASGPVGPWTYRGVLMSSNGVHKGPGHHSFLYNGAMEEWYIVYHRWNKRTGSGPYTGSRSVAIEKMHYESDGRIRPFVLTDSGVGPVWLGRTVRQDFNADGVVNAADLLYLANAWLSADAAGDVWPIGGDGIVDICDLTAVSQRWLKLQQTP